MNSIYGFLGASVGFLPCLAAAAAITSIGRTMILRTKEFVEGEYGATVIYGDTDSVFFKLPDPALPLPEVFRLGGEIAARSTALFRTPITLEFEKA